MGSRVGMAEDIDHTRLSNAFFGLTSKIQIQGRRVQTHFMQNVKVRLTREVARHVAGRNAVKYTRKSGLSSSFVSEAGAVGGRPGRRTRVKRWFERRYGKLERYESTRTGWRKPKTGLRFAGRV